MTSERTEAQWVLRLDGDCSMTSTAELKAVLCEGLASAGGLWVDLEAVEQIDLSVLQLLWAAHEMAARQNREFLSRVPEAIMSLARDAGFEDFLGPTSEARPAVEALEILEALEITEALEIPEG